MSRKAWWTTGLLAAPFLYVLTFPPFYHLICRATDQSPSSGVYGIYTHSGWDRFTWPRSGKEIISNLLALYETPYWTFGSVPPLDMPFLGYYAFWQERILI